MFLYDFLSGKTSLEKSKKISLKKTLKGESLVDDFQIGFEYSDCRVDDARLVVLNALQAQQYGANILLPFRCVSIKKQPDCWLATLTNHRQDIITVTAKAIVNAAGPWVADVIQELKNSHFQSSVKLIKGSHIVIPKLYEGDHAYILQNKDGRIIFALPYGFTDIHKNDFTLIGTTDIDFHGDPRGVEISDNERCYLCRLINRHFKKQISTEDIIWDYAGVRPLYNDHVKNPSKITREYHLELKEDNGKHPILSIFGGKITTYRTLSQQAVNQLKPFFPKLPESKTYEIPTLGGDSATFKQLLQKVKRAYPWLEPSHAYRLSSSYGTLSFKLLGTAKSYRDLGQCFGFNFYETEVAYLVKQEWCHTIEALLWRRTKIGLWLSKAEQTTLSQWLAKFTS